MDKDINRARRRISWGAGSILIILFLIIVFGSGMFAEITANMDTGMGFFEAFLAIY